MPLPLKSSAPTAANIQQLTDEIQSWIYTNPTTIDQCCGFYEKLDSYLGPWGPKGYLIGYGKRYCVAFNSNKKLKRNINTWQWVRNTTLQLQRALKDYVIDKFREGALASLSPHELENFAFDSHPSAYDKGGLVNVAIDAPEMLPIIAEIPQAEFEPASRNFYKSVRQVFATAGLVIPKIPVVILAVRPTLTMLNALPAHRSILTRGNRSGLSKILQFQKTNERLVHLHKKINAGSLDNVVVLETIIKQLEFERFPDVGFRHYADRVILDAKKRKKYVQEYYMSLPGSAK